MTLVLPGVDLTPASTEDRSQWFTPAWLATKVVEWSAEDVLRIGTNVLEPSCGSGALLDPLFALFPRNAAIAYDIDQACIDRVVAKFAYRFNLRAYCADFRGTNASLGVPIDLALMNPPYEGGLDGVFLEHAMACSNAIVAIVHTVALNGDERYQRVWSRIEEGQWQLRGIRFLIKRPAFIAGEHVGADRSKDGAKADFCVVKLVRRGSVYFDENASCDVGWW